MPLQGPLCVGRGRGIGGTSREQREGNAVKPREEREWWGEGDQEQQRGQMRGGIHD